MKRAWKPASLWAIALFFMAWFGYDVYGLVSNDSGSAAGIAIATLVSGAVAGLVLRMAIQSTRVARRRKA